MKVEKKLYLVYHIERLKMFKNVNFYMLKEKMYKFGIMYLALITAITVTLEPSVLVYQN